MELVKSIIILVIGFALLMKGADYFVEGSSSVAKRLYIPSMIIGMTIVAMGTSLPECAVSVTASLAGNNTLAVSNVVGSNIFNLMVVWMINSVKKARAVHKEDELMKESGEYVEDEIRIIPMWKSILFIVGGMIAIKFGGDFVVDSASDIALSFGLSQTLIGLTIVALGTSLPELVTSIVAARKNEVDMALGNVIGSNIFNILLVLGIAAAISPVGFLMDNIVDTLILIIMSSAVLVFAWTSKVINRKEGIAMLCMYAVYMVYICMR